MLSYLLAAVQNVTFSSYTGVCRYTKWIASYVFIIFHKRTSRMYKYDMKITDKPDKIGFLIPPEEWDLECSQENQGTDEMFCCGVNSYGECLALQIARECACDSSSYLFLKIDGHTYTLPSKYNYMITNDERVFGSNRFYMQCLAPFRRWKIFFNGILREVCPSENIDQHIHVRFSLIWVASSGVFDFISDYSSSNIVDILSKIKWNSYGPPIKKVLSILNEYHQPGMLHGTFQLGNDSEREIRLWGCRRHAFGTKIEDMECYIDLFGNSENGHLFYFKIFKLDDQDWNSSAYVMLPNGYLKAIDVLSSKRLVNGTKNILYFRTKAEDIYYNISAIFYEYGKFAGKQRDTSVTVSVVDTIVNGVWGSGVAIERVCAKHKLHEKCELILSLLKSKKISKDSVVDAFTLTLEDPRSLKKCLSGNFGSNLAKVYQMKDHILSYSMENALVITTSGYEEYMSSLQQTIKNLEEYVYKYDTDELLPLCERIVEEISNSHFPLSLHDAVSDHLNNLLTNAKRASFCIYPSFCGEGANVQLLEAYLLMYRNVCGLSEIIKCVKKCWASQFSFLAIQCKRSTGQLLNMPMAVIIQKNVSFKTSGVISTCESSTGNPSIMEIREALNKSSGVIRIIQLLRNSKDSVVIETSTTVNVDNNPGKDDENTSDAFDQEKCLSEVQILFLGKLACKIDKFFRFPLCIEWCFRKKKFCILQVRPITLLNSDTKSEMLHYWDSYLRSEDEWFSVYSTGEGFVGAVSPLGMNLLNFCTEVFMSKLKDTGVDLWTAPQVPYFPKCLSYSHYHVMLCLADGIFRLKFLNTFFKTLSCIMNLKIAEDEMLYELISQRQEPCNSNFKIMRKSIGVMFSSAFKSEKIEKKFTDYDLNSEDKSTSRELFYQMSNHYEDLTEAFINFMYYTYKDVLWNMLVFYILEKMNRKESDGIYNDYNFLMSACSKLEEGDIAYDILALSMRIVANIEPSTFKKMPLEDALIWLEDSEIDKKIKFSDFLDKHGHRCYKEVDVFQKCWIMDPVIVVQVLQHVVPLSPRNFPSQISSIDPVFNQLSVMPNFLQRWILKYTIPRCCKATRQAKEAKSFLLKVVLCWRKAFYNLADCAVKEFRIPFPEALFFLSLNEIDELLTSRSPDLVKRALKCWEIHADVDKLTFPVITIEHPIPLNGNYYDNKRLSIGSCLKGLPMSRGTAVGTAVVISNFNEATSIEKGAVLIAESPSIIWSLYFPALGGFAADLGGVLSEGATAARDYGLPCVIGLIRATKVIKTGDRVFLDANVGILRRVSPH